MAGFSSLFLGVKGFSSLPIFHLCHGQIWSLLFSSPFCVQKQVLRIPSQAHNTFYSFFAAVHFYVHKIQAFFKQDKENTKRK